MVGREQLEVIERALEERPVIVLLDSDCGEAVEVETIEELNKIAPLT
jgi:5S rRNA maturation endonuclease (ribonuclease M5)